MASSSVPSAISSLIQPASSSIGQKLLVKLGWRPGQGIGPRVSARKRRIQERKLQSGGATAISFQVDDADDLDDAEASKHTYAPRDTKLPVYDGKQGKEGLGYTGGQTEKLPSRAGPGGQADVGISGKYCIY
jgi:G patch domain-containing protein 1